MLSAQYFLRCQVIRCRIMQRAVDLTRHGANRQAPKLATPACTGTTALRKCLRYPCQAAQQEMLTCRAKSRLTTGHAPTCW